MGCSKNSSKREVYSNIMLPQETEETSNRQPNFTPKTTGKRTKSPKISRRKEIIKIHAEINEKEMKETIVKINRSKSWLLRRKTKLTNLQPDSSRKQKNQINRIRNEKGEVTTEQKCKGL